MLVSVLYTDYINMLTLSTASPMNPNISSPVQNFPQGNGISPSPQMSRVIPSQANNRYMQQMNVQQQQMNIQQQQQQQQQNIGSASPSMNHPSTSSYASPQDTSMDDQNSKSYNMSGYVQQSPMQTHASPIPRQSATPGSTHSTPRQQHQQIDNLGTPHMSPAKSTPTVPMSNTNTAPLTNTTPSPKPSSVPSESVASPDQQQKLPQQQITYIPKTRNVETYGGVDLKYFDKF